MIWTKSQLIWAKNLTIYANLRVFIWSELLVLIGFIIEEDRLDI